MDELPGDDKAHLSSLKGLRADLDTVVAEYTRIGKDPATSGNTKRRHQNALLDGDGMDILKRMKTTFSSLKSTEDLAHQQMSAVVLESAAVLAAGSARGANQKLYREATETRSSIYK
ncbi:hypothetical protein KIPB_013288, partial [Kipferlia bialata]|eukprot:g13288.t1